MSDARGNVDLVGHLVVPLSDAAFADADNVIVQSDDPELAWATEAMRAV